MIKKRGSLIVTYCILFEMASGVRPSQKPCGGLEDLSISVLFSVSLSVTLFCFGTHPKLDVLNAVGLCVAKYNKERLILSHS